MTFNPVTPDKWKDCSWCYGAATRKGSDGRLYCDYCPDASVIDLNTMRPVLEGK
jgi:hypothetical protein